LTIFGQYLLQHYFATLDGTRFLLSDITQDLPALTDMHVPTLARMLNVLQLLVLDQNFPNSLCPCTPSAFRHAEGVHGQREFGKS